MSTTHDTFESALAAVRTAEMELMLQRERVAEMRRSVPAAATGDDYEFQRMTEGQAESIRLSELFTGPDRTLIIYHFMYGKQQAVACPMCSMWADGWNAITPALERRVDFVVAASAPIGEWTELARARDWGNLRLVSADLSSFKLDVGGEDAEGNQWPFISVWTLDADGRPVQRYGGGAGFDTDHWRGLDLLAPAWNLLDLTPEGRGDFMPG